MAAQRMGFYPDRGMFSLLQMSFKLTGKLLPIHRHHQPYRLLESSFTSPQYNSMWQNSLQSPFPLLKDRHLTLSLGWKKEACPPQRRACEQTEWTSSTNSHFVVGAEPRAGIRSTWGDPAQLQRNHRARFTVLLTNSCMASERQWWPP